MDSSKYINFFENLKSPNKEIRQQAEKDLEKMKQLPIEQSFPIFQTGISSNDENISQLSSLMFKKVYLENKNIMSNLTVEQILQMKNFLKSQITFNQNKSWKTLQRIADNLSHLYQLSDMKESFSEILSWFNNNEPLARKFAIYIIEVLSDLLVFKNDLVKSNLNDFKSMFNKGLNDNDIQVKVSSIISLTQFIINLNDDSLIEEFSQLIDTLLISVFSVIGKNENLDKEILDSLNYLTDKHPKFWKSKIEVLIELVVKIAKEKILLNTIRSSSLELIYSLTKNMPSKIRKSNNFKNLLIPELFELIKEIENIKDINTWEKILIDDENDLDDMFYSVKSGFERLSIDLGGKFFMEIISPYIKNYLSSENWIDIYSAFMILASISEGCKEVYKENLVELLDYISKALTNSNQIVKYSALVFFENFIRETSPIIQKQYTNNILPGLAILLSENEKSLKVKNQACSVLVEFLSGLISKNKESIENSNIIEPYSKDLILLISNLFEQSLSLNYSPLQKSTLDCISLIANTIDFSNFYDTIMPGLKKLYYNIQPKNEKEKELKSKCIETISYIFSSINNDYEKYTNDLKEISESFVKNLDQLSEEDPQLNAILSSFNQISLTMGEQFLPILDYLFPYLEKYIKEDIQLKIEDADIGELIPNDNNNNKIGSVVVNLGTNNTKLSLDTFALQNKITAFEVLNDICINLGNDFFPYTERFLNLSKQLLKFPYSRKLRKTAVKSVYSCINSCHNDDERSKILKFVEDDIIGVFEYNIKNKFFREIKNYLKRFCEFCPLFENKNYIPENFIIKIYEILGNVVKLTQEKTKDILSLTNNEDGFYDENDAGDQKADIDKLVEINRRVMELSGILFGLFGENLTEKVKQNLGEFFLLSWEEGIKNSQINNEKIPFEQYILTSICFFCDYMEYSDINTFNSFYDKFIELSKKSNINEDCLQNIISGYGIICKRMENNLFNEKYKDKLISFIKETFKRPLYNITENTYDSCISALGKYIFYKCENNNENINSASEFIKLIPLKYDKDENTKICNEFMEQIINNNPLILNDVNHPLAKEAILRIIEKRKEDGFEGISIDKLIIVSILFQINAENI